MGLQFQFQYFPPPSLLYNKIWYDSTKVHNKEQIRTLPIFPWENSFEQEPGFLQSSCKESLYWWLPHSGIDGILSNPSANLAWPIHSSTSPDTRFQRSCAITVELHVNAWHRQWWATDLVSNKVKKQGLTPEAAFWLLCHSPHAPAFMNNRKHVCVCAHKHARTHTHSYLDNWPL